MIDVFVCRRCDRNPTIQETPAAEGGAFLKVIRRLLAAETDVRVRPTDCLGGCDCGAADAANGCCSVGFAAQGKYSYVFNRLNPTLDSWKLVEFLRLYRKRKTGRITCADSSRVEELRGHVATRVPPFSEQ